MRASHAQAARTTNGNDASSQPLDPTQNPTRDTNQPAWYGRSYDAFSWISLLGGLWIAISPWVVDFASGSSRLTINNLVIGLAAAFIAMGSMTALRGITGSGLANVVLGAWIIVTAFVLLAPPATAGFKLSQIIGGAVILVFAAAGQFGSHANTRA